MKPGSKMFLFSLPGFPCELGAFVGISMWKFLITSEILCFTRRPEVARVIWGSRTGDSRYNFKMRNPENLKISDDLDFLYNFKTADRGSREIADCLWELCVSLVCAISGGL